MVGVGTIARIRFEHFLNGKGIKSIARELGIARDTVRKVLRSNATAFTYVDLTRDVDDPVELLMNVQLGGGTDIQGARLQCLVPS
jgi:plasmid maintenance system antidote protein VapI